MKRFLFGLTCISVILFGELGFCSCAVTNAKTVIPNKQYVSKIIDVGAAFKAISLVGNCDVVYTPAASGQHVELYASDNIIDLIEVVVENNVLVVKTKKDYQILRKNDKMELRVSAPMVEKATVTGSGNITFTKGFSVASLALKVTGSGDINAASFGCKDLTIGVTGSGNIQTKQADVDNVKASITGSGDIELTGTANAADYLVTGSGDIKAASLKVLSVSARVTGSGDIRCNAVEKLNADWTGSGTIQYKGEPVITTSRKKGGLKKID